MSIVAHWIVRPYRDTACNIMIVMFEFCDLLALLSSPLQKTVSTTTNSTTMMVGGSNTTSISITNVEPSSSSSFEDSSYHRAKLDQTYGLQLLFLICIFVTITSAFGLVGNAVIKAVRAVERKKQIDIIRKIVEAELFGEESAADRDKKKKDQALKEAEFSFVEKILIFPTYSVVWIIKRSVKFAVAAEHAAEHKLHDLNDTIHHRGHGNLRKHKTNQAKLKDLRTKIIKIGPFEKYMTTILLFPVKLFLFVIGVVLNFISRICSFGSDKSHLGGDHTMYNALMTSGPEGIPMEMVEVPLKIRKLELLEMKINCNIVKSTGELSYKHLVCQIVQVKENGTGAKLGFLVDDIIMGVHSDSGGSHVIKPSSDCSKHLQVLMHKASHPLYLTVMREKEEIETIIPPSAEVVLQSINDWDFDATKPEVIMKKKKKKKKKKHKPNPKFNFQMNHDELVLNCEILFEEYDEEEKGWLTKDQLRGAYFEALGKNVDDDQFEYLYRKMDPDA